MPAVCKSQDLETSCLSHDCVESHVIRSKCNSGNLCLVNMTHQFFAVWLPEFQVHDYGMYIKVIYVLIIPEAKQYI